MHFFNEEKNMNFNLFFLLILYHRFSLALIAGINNERCMVAPYHSSSNAYYCDVLKLIAILCLFLMYQ